MLMLANAMYVNSSIVKGGKGSLATGGVFSLTTVGLISTAYVPTVFIKKSETMVTI